MLEICYLRHRVEMEKVSAIKRFCFTRNRYHRWYINPTLYLLQCKVENKNNNNEPAQSTVSTRKTYLRFHNFP